MKNTLIVLAVVMAALSFLVGGAYRSMLIQSREVDEQWARVQAAYEARGALADRLYAAAVYEGSFQGEPIITLARARSSADQVHLLSALAPSDVKRLLAFQAAQDTLGAAVARLVRSAEHDPHLLRAQGFRELCFEWSEMERRITFESGEFNGVVLSYNNRVKTFPGAVVANLLDLPLKPIMGAPARSPSPLEFEFGPAPGPFTKAGP